MWSVVIDSKIWHAFSDHHCLLPCKLMLYINHLLSHLLHRASSASAWLNRSCVNVPSESPLWPCPASLSKHPSPYALYCNGQQKDNLRIDVHDGVPSSFITTPSSSDSIWRFLEFSVMAPGRGGGRLGRDVRALVEVWAASKARPKGGIFAFGDSGCTTSTPCLSSGPPS